MKSLGEGRQHFIFCQKMACSVLPLFIFNFHFERVRAGGISVLVSKGLKCKNMFDP